MIKVKMEPVRAISLWPNPRPWWQFALGGFFVGVMTVVVLAAVMGVPLWDRSVVWMLALLPVFGAVSNTAPAALTGGSLFRTFTVTATADADATTGAIAHGLPAAPDLIELRPIDPAARISLWVVTAVDATNITLGKATTAGSGAAGAQLRVTLGVLHSIVR